MPYLDHRIIEFVLSLRPEWRGGTGKIGKPLLKAVAERQLPRSFVHRPKQGFRAPVREWRESAFGERFIPLLFEFARRTGLLNVRALEQLVGHGGRLYFSLTNFMLWYLLFVENVLADRIDDELLASDRFSGRLS